MSSRTHSSKYVCFGLQALDADPARHGDYTHLLLVQVFALLSCHVLLDLLSLARSLRTKRTKSKVMPSLQPFLYVL